MPSDRMRPLNHGRFLRQPALTESMLSDVKLQWDSHTRTELPPHTELRAFCIFGHIESGTSFIVILCLLFQIIIKITPVLP